MIQEELLKWLEKADKSMEDGIMRIRNKKYHNTYGQIRQIINTYYLLVRLDCKDYAAGYEQGLFDEKMNRARRRSE